MIMISKMLCHMRHRRQWQYVVSGRGEGYVFMVSGYLSNCPEVVGPSTGVQRGWHVMRVRSHMTCATMT